MVEAVGANVDEPAATSSQVAASSEVDCAQFGEVCSQKIHVEDTAKVINREFF